MVAPFPLSRRQALRLCASSVAVVCGSARIGPGLILPHGNGRAPFAGTLRDLFPDPSSLRAVGALYLRRYPEELASVRHLMRAAALRGSGSSNAFARMIAERRRIDLERGDVVIVAGWILARSEALLCAAASLDAAAS